MSDSATPWTAARQASLSITNSWSVLASMSIKLVLPFNDLLLCHLLCSCLQSFPASGSFPVSQFLASGGQSIGAKALASSFQWIFRTYFLQEELVWSPCRSKGLSRVFSNNRVQKHQFFSNQFFIAILDGFKTVSFLQWPLTTCDFWVWNMASTD